MSTTLRLNIAMDCPKRYVDIRRLPTVPSLLDIQAKLGCVNLTAQDVIFYGLSPALIHQAIQREIPALTAENLGTDYSDDDVRRLCRSFVHDFSPVKFEQFIDSDENGNVHWVPFYMVQILHHICYECTDTCSEEVLSLCSAIASAFADFHNSAPNSEMGWKHLFLAVTLICLVVCEEDGYTSILPWFRDMSESDTMRLDNFLPSGSDAAHVEDPKEYLELMSKAGDRKSHISLYRPALTARFQHYEFFVALWTAEGERFIHGYQLKGNDTEKTALLAEVDWTYVIVGKPPADETCSRESGSPAWSVVNEATISSFFGVAGAHWTPTKWKELTDSK
jgi:hypothetical protein